MTGRVVYNEGAGDDMPDFYVYPKTGDPFTVPLKPGKVTIGRAPTNDLVLSDQFSSGCHASVYPTQSGFVLLDHGSKNGTFVNGKKVTGEIMLARGDEILIGSTRIYFDREFQSSIEMVEGTTFTHSSNTIIQVKDILRKPPTAADYRTPGGGLDLGRLQQEQKMIAVMGEVSQALIYHMPLDKLLNHIMDVLIQYLPMDRGVLMLKDPATGQLAHKVVRVQSGALRTQNITISKTIVQTAVEKNSAILLSDIRSDDRFVGQASIIQAQIHSAMCIPLWNNMDIIGLIYADRASLVEQFTEDDLKLLTLLANLAAVKIENARLYEDSLKMEQMEREMAMAVQIQRNFLPRGNPWFEPYDISGSMRACHHVGGDYYDFLPAGDDRLGIVIADVSGTGVSAALLMANLRGALTEKFPVTPDLGELAAKLNDFVHSSSDSHCFISFFLAVLDRDRDRLTYVNAGHNPPLLVDDRGQVSRLESTGLCLGMFPAQAYGQRTIDLGPGDVLCLYTDGIVEGRNKDGEEFGEERLAGILKSVSAMPARGIMERIYEEVLDFTGCAEAGDDMTLVVVRKNPRRENGERSSTERDVRELRVPAALESVDRVREFLRAYMSEQQVPDEEALAIELSLHEICVNIAMYAYPGGPAGEMSVRIWNDDGLLFIEVRDRGVLFDPSGKPDPDLLTKVRRGQRGGLGVYFFKTLMDGFTYRRENGENVLTVRKRIPPRPAPVQ
jgi:phosphoserine phosphatase RsbU/P